MSLNFVTSLSSSDALVRQSAETYLKELLQSPSSFITTMSDALTTLDSLAPSLLTSNAPSSVFVPHQMVFVLLRQNLMKWSYLAAEDLEFQIFDSASPALKTSLQSFLLQYLGRCPPQTSSLALKACAVAVGFMGKSLMLDAEDLSSAMSSYPDLLSTLSSTLLNSSSSPISRLAAMRALGSGVIEGIARHFSANPESQYHADFQTQVQSACLSTLTSALSDDHFLVRREAMRTSSTFLQILPTDELRSYFAPLVSTQITMCVNHITSPHTTPDHYDLSVALLENLVELVSCGFFITLAHLPAISQMCFVAVRPPSPPDKDLDSVRQLALELALTIAECNSSYCRSLSLPSDPPSPFYEHLLDSCFTFLLEPSTEESTEEWVAAESSAFDAIDIDHAEIGQDALTRSIICLTPSTMIPPTFSKIHSLLNGPTALHHHAALSSLSCTSSYMTDIQTQNQAISATLPFFSPTSPLSPSPQVTFAAIKCISIMSESFSPTIQETHHKAIITALLHHTSKANTDAARIRSAAISALSTFIELTPMSIASAYIEPILGRLVTAISEGPIIVVESAITGIASVASSNRSNFDSYYPAIAPILKNVLSSLSTSSAITPETYLLRGKALEALSLLFIAVSDKAIVADDMTAVMSATASFDLTTIAPEDPFRTYLIKCWTRIANTAKLAFAPYLPLIMPELIRCMNLDVETGNSADAKENYDDDYDGEFYDEEDYEDDDNSDYKVSTITNREGTKITISTSALEEQAAAVHTTLFLCETLQKHMYPYVEEISKALTKIIRSSFHDDLVAYSVTTFSELVQCVARSNQREGVRFILETFLQSAVLILQDWGDESGSVETLACAVNGIQNALIYAAFDYSSIPSNDYKTDVTELDLGLPQNAVLLTNPQVDSLASVLMSTFDDTLRRMALRVAEAKCNSAIGDYDNHAAEEDRFADDADIELLDIVASLFSTMIKIHSSIFLSLPSITKELIPATLEYLRPHFAVMQRRFSLKILGVLLERCIVPCPDLSIKQSFLKEFIPLLKVCLNPKHDQICITATEVSRTLAVHMPTVVDDDLKHNLLLIVNLDNNHGAQDAAAASLTSLGLQQM